MGTISYHATHAVRCGKCKEAFSFDIKLDGLDTEQDLYVDKLTCPWCDKALVLNLKPYLKPLGIVKSVGADTPMCLDLPDELEAK